MMMGPTTIVLAAVALALFLLVVLVTQASLAKLILQDVRGSTILRGGCPSAVGGEAHDRNPHHLVRSYAVVADVATSAALTSTSGPPPPSTHTRTGSEPCSAFETGANGNRMVVVAPSEYAQTCWLALVHSPGAARLWEDIVTKRVATLMIADTSVRVWTSSAWPSSAPSSVASVKSGQYLFVLANPKSARVIRGSAGGGGECTSLLPTVEPLGSGRSSSSGSGSSWNHLVATLTTTTGGSNDAMPPTPLHIWGY